QGLHIIARIGLTPAWARPPDTPLTYLDASAYDDFAAFAAAFAARYRGQVEYLVIGNEPNLFFTNPKVFERLTSIAKDADLPYQVNALPRAASNDAAALQLSRGGQATAVVAIPNRYMHSPVEVVSLQDLENAAELIARFCLSLTPDCDFTP
ncbi:MAG: hypothetical protein JJ992_17275, partial [Planctomycetes bacterium]|nr:hypothetical protein [Planctomycetota bacterium]